jgi:putative membrane protein
MPTPAAQWIAKVPFRGWLLIAFLLAFPWSLAGSLTTIDRVLHHIPTVAVLAALIATGIRRPLSNVSYGLIFVFMVIHLVGSKYLYSNVPYDAWFDAALGVRLDELFGWERNHFDRFVHLSFGLLMIHPGREIAARLMGVKYGWSYFVSLLFIIALGAFYEHLEWVVAMVMSPETAENYNGQQGDAWDAHKDTVLAAGGGTLSALIEAAVIALKGARKSPVA